MIPFKGDVPPSGFGTTTDAKVSETTALPKELARALTDVQQLEGTLKRGLRRNRRRQLTDLHRKRRASEGVAAVGRGNVASDNANLHTDLLLQGP